MTTPYTPDEARGVAIGIREEGIVSEMWDEIAVTLDRYADLEAIAIGEENVPIPFCPPHLGLVLKHPEEYAIGCIQCERNALKEELARARAVVGPDCPSPKCGHYLKAEHERRYRDTSGVYDDFGCVPCAEGMQRGVTRCEIGLVDLLTNHPEIAKEMGLTE